MGIRLNDLVPQFRDSVAQLLQNCAARGVQMVPTEGLRTPAQQAKYWRQSRSLVEINGAIALLRQKGAAYLANVLEGIGPQNGDEVTKVLPGNSWHQWGEAIDCFWEVNGRAEWSTTRRVNDVNGYQVYAQEARALGLTAGLLWPRFKDAPHVQLRRDDNPLSSGLSWPDIDHAMQERFEGGSDMALLGHGLVGGMIGAVGAQDSIRLSFSAPEGWRVYETSDVAAAVFRAKMAIDADGAPRAYNSNNAIALDNLGNAGRPGNWWALVTDANGNPVVQTAADPAPGYFVSTTTLTNPAFPRQSPRHYVDSSTIPFVVMPGSRFRHFTTSKQLRLGDVGAAYNRTNGRMCFTQFADTGPNDKIGEGSIALANALGINANPKNGGTSNRDVVYVVFPSSGIGQGMTTTQIDSTAQAIFDSWGGLARIKSYADL